MRLILKKHNETAYKKVMAAFEKDRMTCVCHPTGTGKSYIIAAVSEHFERVLILAPGHFILNQQRKLMDGWKEGVDFATYPGLLSNLEGFSSRQYDLIVLDEFHRAGATEWGAAVQLLIESQPQAKIFGTSATPIRYMDGERNMADELFDGHVAIEMSIVDAWNQHILPIPRYVSGLFKWDNVITDAVNRINRSRQLSDDEKRQRIFRLSNKKLDWELSYGMPTILRKHLDKDARRVIVFCSHIETLEQMKSEVCGWFREAGFTMVGSYTLHCNLKDTEKREQMNGFEEDNEDGVKLMFCVDMLNEGIHVPKVSAVLMLRTTSSRIIYMQQMGRCLTTANTEKPLVLDMVDNITTTTAIKGFQEEFELLELKQAEKEGREPREFEVIDYTLGVKKLIEKLAPQYVCFRTKEERKQIIRDFKDKNGRLPNARREKILYEVWHNLLCNAKDDPEVKEWKEKYAFSRSFDSRLNQFKEFYETNHRSPNRKNGKYERMLEFWWMRAYKDHGDNTDIQALAKKMRYVSDKKMNIYFDAIEFYQNNGKFPTNKENEKLSHRINYFIRKYPEMPEAQELKRLKDIQYDRTINDKINKDYDKQRSNRSLGL